MTDNIILVGPMGAGKTTIGKRLAKHLHRPFVDVDETIEKRLGVTIQTIFDTEGESGFREREKNILNDILNENNNAVIATGGGCILTEDCRKMIVCQRLIIHIDPIKKVFVKLSVLFLLNSHPSHKYEKHCHLPSRQPLRRSVT